MRNENGYLKKKKKKKKKKKNYDTCFCWVVGDSGNGEEKMQSRDYPHLISFSWFKRNQFGEKK